MCTLREYQRGKYHCTVDLLFYWFGISCMTTDIFCFNLQNKLIETSETGVQQYNDTSPFSIPWHTILVCTLYLLNAVWVKPLYYKILSINKQEGSVVMLSQVCSFSNSLRSSPIFKLWEKAGFLSNARSKRKMFQVVTNKFSFLMNFNFLCLMHFSKTGESM